MKWHPSGEHRMEHAHMPHAHALHMHPVHWLGEHPMMLALLLAGLITLLIVGLAAMFNPEVKSDMLRPFDYRAIYPYYGATY